MVQTPQMAVNSLQMFKNESEISAINIVVDKEDHNDAERIPTPSGMELNDQSTESHVNELLKKGQMNVSNLGPTKLPNGFVLDSVETLQRSDLTQRAQMLNPDGDPNINTPMSRGITQS